MARERYKSKKIKDLEFQIDFDDNVNKIDVKVCLEPDSGSFYTLEFTDPVTGRDLTDMVLPDPDDELPQIYNEKDLREVMTELFELDSETVFDVQGVAEWDNGIDLNELTPKGQAKARRLLDVVFEEIQAGVICENAIETNGKLYLRFGEIILEVAPKLVIEPD